MKSKEIYRVADLGLAICFTHSSVLSDLDHVCLPIDADRCRWPHEAAKWTDAHSTPGPSRSGNSNHTACLDPFAN
uniref:Uncharacterized protein n=1 Tax=Brassica oleracea var. oleracea TaxID=109376 RepID=A0A0D2ZVI7_BRAOL